MELLLRLWLQVFCFWSLYDAFRICYWPLAYLFYSLESPKEEA